MARFHGVFRVHQMLLDFLICKSISGTEIRVSIAHDAIFDAPVSEKKSKN